MTIQTNCQHPKRRIPRSGRWSLGLLLAAWAYASTDTRAFAQSSAEDLRSDAESAMASDDYSKAQELLAKALAAARSANDAKLRTELQDLRKRAGMLEREFARLRKAREALAQSPDDPGSNEQLGQFYCFVKEDWERGLPMLAKGSNDALREAAEVDLLNQTGRDERLRVGDLWLAAAAHVREPSGREVVFFRARQALMEALQASQDEAERRVVHGRLDKVELYPTRIVVTNTHNGTHNDRGATLCNVLLFQGDKVVSKQTLSLRWERNKTPQAVLTPARERFDRVRIEVVKWHENGGGLAELEVYRGQQNLALGAAVEASNFYNDTCPPGGLVDGRYEPRGDGSTDKCIWLLPNDQPGWIEVHLNRR